jgi:ATP-binding cassette subfamily B protein
MERSTMTDQRSQRAPAPEPPPLLGRFGPGQRHMGPVERAKNRRGTVLRLWSYLRRQRRALLLTVALVACTSALTVMGPYLLGYALDAYVLPGDLAGLARISGLMLGIYALNSVLTWLQSYVMAGAAQRTVRDIRNDLFGRLQTLPLRFFDQRSHGDLMSRLTNDVENINLVLADGIVQMISGVLSMIGIAAVMLWINPGLAIVSVLAITTMSFALNRWLGKRHWARSTA